MREEIWKDIEGFEGLYQVSTLGRVRRLWKQGPKLIKCRTSLKGYQSVYLRKNPIGLNMRVHRLVASAFIPKIEGRTDVNHIDEDRSNNRVDNLEWVNAKSNNNHGTHNIRMDINKGNAICLVDRNGNEVWIHGESPLAERIRRGEFKMLKEVAK